MLHLSRKKVVHDNLTLSIITQSQEIGNGE